MIIQIVSWFFAVVCLLGIVNRKWNVQSVLLCYVMRAIGHTFSISFVVLNLGGLLIYHKDFLIICLMIRILLSLRRFMEVPKKISWIYVSIFVMVGSMLLGAFENGFGYQYVGDIRKFVGFFIPILYIAVDGIYYDNQYIVKWLNRYMSLMLVFCFICWGQLLLTGVSVASNLGLGTEGGGFRVLGSTYAMVFALYTIYLLYTDWFMIGAQQKFSLRTIVFTFAVIILQHNSVWVAFFLGVLVLMIQGFATGRVIDKRMLINVFALSIFATIAFSAFMTFGMGNVLGNTFSKFSQISEGTGTMGDRFLIWSQNLGKLNTVSWIIGQGFGYNKSIVLHGIISEMAIHNAYIETILCGGLISLVSILCLMIKLLKYSWKKSILISSVVISILVYWVAYMYEFEVAVMIGYMTSYLLTGNKMYEYKLEEV